MGAPKMHGPQWPDAPVVGVDLGGSAMRAVLVRNGKVVDKAVGPGGNYAIDAGVFQPLADLIAHWRPHAVGVGSPGVSAREQALAIESQLSQALACRVVAHGDIAAAVLGAHGGHRGAIVAAGTGSFAAAWDGADQWTRTGGHGFILGDEGSAYWIGREVLSGLLRTSDQEIGFRPPDDQLRAAVLDRLAASNLKEAAVAVTRSAGRREALASLAPLLDEFPDSAVAADVSARAIEGLVSIALSTQSKSGVGNFRVHGGVLSGTKIGARVAHRLDAQPPMYSAAFGAALFTSRITLPELE